MYGVSRTSIQHLKENTPFIIEYQHYLAIILKIIFIYFNLYNFNNKQTFTFYLLVMEMRS
jgi:hypothetical protein